MLLGFQVQAYAEETLIVAVASSLYPVLHKQLRVYEQHHDVRIRLVSGSTGRLYNQLMQGAPFDVFIAADRKRPAMLQAKHKQIHSAYLGVRVGMEESNVDRLKQETIKHIALPNPKLAPFGAAAKRVLLQAGLWKQLEPKFVYTQNALQAVMMVDQGLVDAGFVPVSKAEYALAEVAYIAVLLSHTRAVKALYGFLGDEVQSATKVAAPRGSEALASQDVRFYGIYE